MTNLIDQHQSEAHGCKKERYLTCAQWCREHSWPPMGGLRHLIFNAEKNGFKKVIVRVGRRVLLSEKKFLEFIEEKNQESRN